MLKGLIATVMVAWFVVAFISTANTHDGMNDDWFKSLRNGMGGSCCDGADFVRVEDPDWDVEGGRYRVKLSGVWHVVPPQNVVKATNIVGYAIVWPVMNGDGKQSVRCFMPGAAS